jgi:hypothetical protein
MPLPCRHATTCQVTPIPTSPARFNSFPVVSDYSLQPLSRLTCSTCHSDAPHLHSHADPPRQPNPEHHCPDYPLPTVPFRSVPFRSRRTLPIPVHLRLAISLPLQDDPTPSRLATPRSPLPSPAPRPTARPNPLARRTYPTTRFTPLTCPVRLPNPSTCRSRPFRRAGPTQHIAEPTSQPAPGHVRSRHSDKATRPSSAQVTSTSHD